jgi:hypothetical protein
VLPVPTGQEFGSPKVKPREAPPPVPPFTPELPAELPPGESTSMTLRTILRDLAKGVNKDISQTIQQNLSQFQDNEGHPTKILEFIQKYRAAAPRIFFGGNKGELAKLLDKEEPADEPAKVEYYNKIFKIIYENLQKAGTAAQAKLFFFELFFAFLITYKIGDATSLVDKYSILRHEFAELYGIRKPYDLIQQIGFLIKNLDPIFNSQTEPNDYTSVKKRFESFVKTTQMSTLKKYQFGGRGGGQGTARRMTSKEMRDTCAELFLLMLQAAAKDSSFSTEQFLQQAQEAFDSLGECPLISEALQKLTRSIQTEADRAWEDGYTYIPLSLFHSNDYDTNTALLEELESKLRKSANRPAIRRAATSLFSPAVANVSVASHPNPRYEALLGSEPYILVPPKEQSTPLLLRLPDEAEPIELEEDDLLLLEKNGESLTLGELLYLTMLATTLTHGFSELNQSVEEWMPEPQEVQKLFAP